MSGFVCVRVVRLLCCVRVLRLGLHVYFVHLLLCVRMYALSSEHINNKPPLKRGIAAVPL